MTNSEPQKLSLQLRLPALFLLLFVAWTFLTFAGLLEAMDITGLKFFRSGEGALNDPIGPKWFENMVVGLTHIGGSLTLILLSVIALGTLLFSQQRRNAALFVAMVGGIFALTPLLKALFGRARPDLVEHLVHASSASFPSGHALRSAVVYLSLLIVFRLYTGKGLKRPLISLIWALFLGIGISRVYLGVHWPSDIIAGWLLAGFWVSLWQPNFRVSAKN